MDALGLPRDNILAYTLPAFATSTAPRRNAWRLMRALGVSAQEIDVSAACRQMLEDIGHPFARGEAVYDTTYENVQAGARTSLLFRLANLHDALGHRHRRSLGAGARLVHLWRRRSDVALQRQRLRAEDADPASHPLVRARRALRPGHGRCARRHSRDGNLARTRPRRSVRSGRRPLSAPMRCRTSISITRPAMASGRQDRLSIVARMAGRDRRRLAAGLRTEIASPTTSRRSSIGSRFPAALLRDKSVQALGRAQRPEGQFRRIALAARRLARAATCRRRPGSRRSTTFPDAQN